MDLLGLLAAACGGLFAGAAIYINAVEHPARLVCGTRIALAQWAPSYKRATVMQASLALLGTFLGLGAWAQTRALLSLIATLSLFSVVPFTLLVILPTNRALLSLDPDSERAEPLLRRWGWLHAVRSFLGAAAFLMFLLQLARQ